MQSDLTLHDLGRGEYGQIRRVDPDGAVYRRLLDLGFTRGAGVKRLFSAFAGDPTVYWIRETAIALRKEQARMIHVIRVRRED